MRRVLVVIVVLASVSLLAEPVGARAPTVPLPAVIAAVGDSITAATDVGWCCVDPSGGNPDQSWATGTDPAVESQRLRLDAQRQARGLAPVTAVNLSRPGADSGDLDGQLTAATRAGPGGVAVDYVMVLIGGNDLCVASADAMTSPPVFRQRIRNAFARFFARAPRARMLVASIPDIYRLWTTARGAFLAQPIWDLFHVCPSMLASSRTEAERQAVVARETALNRILATECARQRRCRWDGGSLSRAEFTAGDVSPVDHYHPSVAGQRLIARITTAVSYWPK